MTHPTPTLALDIETIATCPDPSFNTPSDWDPFAVSLAARLSPDTTPTTRVILRESADARGARKLLAAVTNWIQATLPPRVHDDDVSPTLLTFNGRAEPVEHLDLPAGYDLPIINHVLDTTRRNRPQHATLDAAWNLAFDRLDHRDLFVDMIERRPRGASWPSLEAACRDHDIDLETPRIEGQDRVIDGAACAELGRAVMDGSITDAERAAIMEYARQDAKVLLELERKMSETTKPTPEVNG